MIKNSIVLIPTNLPLSWSTDYYSQTASILSINNIVVFYLWEQLITYKTNSYFKKILQIIKKEKNIYYFTPIQFLPLRRFQLIENLNIMLNIQLVNFIIFFLSKKKRISKKILWVFDPVFFPVANTLLKSFLVIYDCVDYYKAGAQNSTWEFKIEKFENNLLEKADIVTSISNTLIKVHKRVRNSIYLVPQGFRLDSYQLLEQPSKQLYLNKPVIGYIGGINYRINFDLLDLIAQKFPECYLLLIGTVQKNDHLDYITNVLPGIIKISRHKNIIFLQNIPKNQIPYYVKNFNIGIIPYKNELMFNKYSYPMKLFEYFYFGKPVISSPIDELKYFYPYVLIANNSIEWVSSIKKNIKNTWPNVFKNKQKKIAIQNSWNQKLETISDIIENNNKYKKM